MNIQSFSLGFLCATICYIWIIPLLERNKLKRKQERETNKYILKEAVKKVKSELAKFTFDNGGLTVKGIAEICELINFVDDNIDVTFVTEDDEFIIQVKVGASVERIGGNFSVFTRRILDN